MNDRELLELAAKAAGLPVEFVDEYGDTEVNGFWPCGYGDDGDVLEWWNPLTDDGDALRLAVKLAIDLYFHETEVEATAFQADPDEHGVHPFGIEPAGDDSGAATRRAIVRAAAEIGRAMK